VNPDTLAFAGIALAVAVVPGPDMALVTRNTLLGGRTIGVATVAGIVAGLLVWGALAAAGIAAILAASTLAFTIVKLAGAIYLVYLGISTLRAGDGGSIGIAGTAPMSGRTAAGQGVLSAVLNPKLGVFFITLLPQFAGTTDVARRSLELTLLFAGIGMAWLLVYTYALGAVGHVLARPRPRRAVRWVSGTVLIGLGARVALDRS
jgi:threonine/homoserine/homoserine lactone efflux protein